MAVPLEFRRIFARHDREVLAVTVGALLFAAAGWMVLFGFTYWLAVLHSSIVDRPAPRAASLLRPFGEGAVVAIVVTQIVEWLNPHHRRASQNVLRPFLAVEILLFIPQLTITALQNPAAFIFLRGRQRLLAWQIAELLAEHEKISVQTLPAYFSGQPELDRPLRALQAVGLVRVFAEGSEWMLALANDDARAICHPPERLKA